MRGKKAGRDGQKEKKTVKEGKKMTRASSSSRNKERGGKTLHLELLIKVSPLGDPLNERVLQQGWGREERE